MLDCFILIKFLLAYDVCISAGIVKHLCVRECYASLNVIVMYNLKVQIMIKCAFLFLRGIWQRNRNENKSFNVKSQDLEMHYNLWFINMQVSASLKNFETCHDNIYHLSTDIIRFR